MLRRMITERHYPAHAQDDFMRNNLKWYVGYYLDRYVETLDKDYVPYTPRGFEEQRLRYIQDADALRNKNQFHEALQTYRKAVPLVPETHIARMLAENWGGNGKIFALPRFDRLTAYKQGTPLNSMSPVSMATFFHGEKATPMAETALSAEEERKRQPEWLRECTRCYAAYWCAVMKKQV